MYTRPARALLHRAFDGRELGVLARDQRPHQLAEQHAALVRGARPQGDVDVQAARARRLGEALDAQRVQLFAHPPRDLDHRRERCPLERIEVDGGEVEIVDRSHARKPGILRDGRDLRHVEQRGQRSAHEARRHLLVGGDAFDAHAGRRVGGRALLVEGGTADRRWESGA